MGNSSLAGNSTDTSGNSTSLDLSSSESTELRLVKLSLYALIFLVSVVGNTLVCTVIIRRRQMRTVTNCFILNLAVADLATTCICIPFDIPVQENNYRWPYGAFLCKTLYPLQTMAVFASIFTLMAVSLNRFRAIVYPFKKQMTKKHAKGFIAGIWALSAILVFPYSLVLRLDEEVMSCEENWPGDDEYRKAYTLSLFLVQYVFPLTVITIAYSKIALEMRKCMHKRRSGAWSNKALKSTRQLEGKRVIRMLVVVTVLFAICVLPNNIMWLWLDFGNGGDFEYFWHVVTFTNIILFANSAANPVAYTICHENFRDEFRRYFACDRSIFKPVLETTYRSVLSAAPALSHYKPCVTTALTSLQLTVKSEELKQMLNESPETNV